MPFFDYYYRVPELLPVWNLNNLYKGFGDPRWLELRDSLINEGATLLGHLDSEFPSSLPERAQWLLRQLEMLDHLHDNLETLSSFTYLHFSINTGDALALKEINRIEKESLALQRAGVKLRKTVALPGFALQDLIPLEQGLADRAFLLQEMKVLAEKEMAEDLEDLAADLNRSGGEAWGRLQQAVSSHLSVVWDPETGEKKTMVELRQAASDPERLIRQKAWKLEIEAWKTMEISLSSALNGVKGFTATVNERRGWPSTLHSAAFQSRLSMKGLDALISSIRKNLGIFHRYLQIKAKALKIPMCSFYDLFAPIGASEKRYTWKEAQDFIGEQFGAFSPNLKNYAKTAFENEWIHALTMPGKVGGAYCTSLPAQGESRILCNFDGTFGEVKTLAHELGHGFHFEVLKDATSWKRAYPMTLAETASTFAETLVFEAAYKNSEGNEALFLLENQLQDITQVCVDILSRFDFESELMRRRPLGELSSDELCEIMLNAQKNAYGLGLNANELHPYMWAVKGHYYSPEQAFYNYPYAFGQLFSLSLYQKFLELGPSFSKDYERLLEITGSSDCKTVVAEIGEDIESEDFWDKGMAFIQHLTDQLEERVK